MTPRDDRPAGHHRLWGFLGFIAVMLILAASWRWTPLGDWLDTDRLTAWLALFEQPWVRFLSVFGVIVVTSLLMLPMSLLVVVSALLLGPWLGFACAMAGALVSGAIAFVVGERMGGRILEHYSGSRVHRLSLRLAERGILAVAVMRLVPVAPYTVINLVAGATHLRLGSFMVGSAIGLAPPVAALALFSDSLFEAVRNPSVESLGVLAVVVLIIAVAALGLRRLLNSS